MHMHSLSLHGVQSAYLTSDVSAENMWFSICYSYMMMKYNQQKKSTHFFPELVAELRSQLPDVDNIFTIHRRIGEGTFSTVFLTSLKCQEHVPANQKRFFALKYLIPTSHPRRIAQELRCLKEIG